MDPVDGEVGKEKEEWELKPIIPHPRTIGSDVVHLTISAHFGKEKGNCTHGHDGYGLEGLSNLELDLIFQKFGVFESFFVENKVVRESAEGKVYEETKEPIDLLYQFN